MLQLYMCADSVWHSMCACRRCGTSVQSFCGNTSVCLCVVAAKTRIRCLCGCSAFTSPWSCMCSAMHIDLCALNWYGCLLVALDMSVRRNATVNSFQPIDRIFDADVQSPPFFFYCKLHATGKKNCILLLLLQYLIELMIYYVLVLYQLCI